MRKYFAMILVLVMMLAASVFITGCGSDDGGSDSATIPEDFLGVWTVMLMQDVGDYEIIPMTDLITTTLEITEADGEAAFVLKTGTTIVDMGTAEWDVRSSEKYLILTSADGEVGEMKIMNYDNYACEAIAIDDVDGDMYWFMARDNGIFGTVSEYSTFTAIEDAEVIVIDKDGNQVGDAKTVNEYGAFYFSAVSSTSFPITVQATATDFQDYIYPINQSQVTPTFVHMSMLPPIPVGTVTGTLTNASDNTSLSGTPVTVTIGTEYSVISDMGSFVLSNIPVGQYTITATATDFYTYATTINVVEGANSHNIALNPVTSSTATVQGVITNSQTGSTMTGYNVTLTIGADTQIISNGTFLFTNVPVGSNLITAACDGFIINSYNENFVEGLNTIEVLLTPESQQPGGLAKIELHWDANSSDLDLYTHTPEIAGNEYEVYYNYQGSLTQPPYLYHNGDHMDGPGPEVIDVATLQGGTYHVYAQNHSDTFGADHAFVVFKDANDNILETISAYNAGGISSGEWWYIATFDGLTEQITSVNTISDDNPMEGGGNPDTHVGTVSMSWTASGWDFDLTCVTPVINGSVHWVFDYGSLTSTPFVLHTGDELSGPATESILISQIFPGTYQLYADLYDGSFNAGGCTVTVYDNEGELITTVNAYSATGTGDVWHIGTIDGTNGQWTTENRIDYDQPMLKYHEDTRPTKKNR